MTMKQQLKHMIKYKYVPFTTGKPKHGDGSKSMGGLKMNDWAFESVGWKTNALAGVRVRNWKRRVESDALFRRYRVEATCELSMKYPTSC